jgi:hypothetical protein
LEEAKLSSKMATMKIKTRTSCTAYKLLWDKTDRQEYKNTFNCILTQNMDITWEGDTIDQKLDYLTRVMREIGVTSSSKYSAKSSRCSSGVHAVFTPFLMQSDIFYLASA